MRSKDFGTGEVLLLSLYICIQTLVIIVTEGQFPHWQNQYIYIFKKYFFLKFWKYIFSIIYYNIVIMNSEIIQNVA